jgi:hypothetical protein
MRVPNTVHEAHPWVMSQIAPDFRLLDVWALPVHGGREDFGRLLETMAAIDPTRATSAPTRALFAVRLLLGRVFGWDDSERRAIPGCSETTLADRLPDELRSTDTGPELAEGLQHVAGGFTPLFRTDDEWAAELSNATVHGVLQLTWVEQAPGRYQGQLAVYVKPRGRLGDAYMLMIEPFRHLVVYPALLRQIGRAWDARDIARSS